MKELYAVLLVIVGGIAGLLLHERNTNEIKQKQAELDARYQAQLDEAEARNKAVQFRRIAILAHLDPLYSSLYEDLNPNHPWDIVPTLAVIRERLQDAKTKVTADRYPVYAAADQLLAAMIEAGEDRTTALQALLEAAARKNTLESQMTSSNSAAFFTSSTLKKWADVRNHRKAVTDQLRGRVREMELEINKKADPMSGADSYEVPGIAPALIRVNTVVAGNPLEKGSYNRDRPWRRVYYDAAGYHYSVYR